MQDQPSALFSHQAANGKNSTNSEKYRIEANCPMIIKGCSAGMAPIHVRIKTSVTRVQNRSCENGRNARPRCLETCNRGTAIRMSTEARRATTPPSLFGTDRRMAYANKKYHSGLMWGGVTIGLAG